MDIRTAALLAKYNAHANREMGRIISTLSSEEWDREFPGYYRSVHALCAHIHSGDVLWLRRFLAIKDFSFSDDAVLARSVGFTEEPFSSMADYHEKRAKLDDIFLSFSGELRQADLSSMLEFVNVKGEKHRKPVWALVLHCFNHQTHHRAMVSLYLELLGKPNDFSNLYPLA